MYREILAVNGFPEASGTLATLLHHIGFVNIKQLAVAHQNFAVADGVHYAAAVHTEENMAVAIVRGHRSERLVICSDDVGVSPLFDNSQGLLEEAAANLGIVFEEHGGEFAPSHGGIAEVMFLNDVAHFVAFQHIVSVAVSTQSQC